MKLFHRLLEDIWRHCGSKDAEVSHAGQTVLNVILDELVKHLTYLQTRSMMPDAKRQTLEQLPTIGLVCGTKRRKEFAMLLVSLLCRDFDPSFGDVLWDHIELLRRMDGDSAPVSSLGCENAPERLRSWLRA